MDINFKYEYFVNPKKKVLNSLKIWGIVIFIFLFIYLVGKYSNYLIIPHAIFFIIPFGFIHTFSPLIHNKKPFLVISESEIKYFGDFRFKTIQLSDVKSYAIDKERLFLHIDVLNSPESISINLSVLNINVDDLEGVLVRVFS